MRVSVGVGIVVIGIGAFALGTLSYVIQIQFLKRAQRIEGVIVDHKKKISDDGVSWYPVVRYILPNGQEITFQSRASTFRIRKSLPLNKSVGVLYDPYRPERAIIDNGLEKAGPYAAGLFGIVLLILGIFIQVGLLPK